MSAVFVRRLSVLLGVLAVAGITQQLVASRLAQSRLERETDREGDLEDQLSRTNWRVDQRGFALKAYTEGRLSLAEAARRFRHADQWDSVSTARVRRLWPDAPSDDERYAAEVVQVLRDLVERSPSEVALLVRAEADFWHEFGTSPDPVG